ncbi:MAG: hypothetical protein ACPGUZ_02205 [Holosporaceae bacterium]
MCVKKTAIVLCVMALCTGPSWVMAAVSDSGSGLDYKKKSSWKFWKSKPQAQKQDELFKKINKYIGVLNTFDQEIAEDLKVADSIHQYLETKNKRIPEAEREQVKALMRKDKVKNFPAQKAAAEGVQKDVRAQRDTYNGYLEELKKKDLDKDRLANIKKTTSRREKWLKAQRGKYVEFQGLLYGFFGGLKSLFPAKQQKVRQKRLDKIVNTDYFQALDADTQKVLQDARNVS